MVILSSEYSEGVGDYGRREQYNGYILCLTHVQHAPNFDKTSSYRSLKFCQPERYFNALQFLAYSSIPYADSPDIVGPYSCMVALRPLRYWENHLDTHLRSPARTWTFTMVLLAAINEDHAALLRRGADASTPPRNRSRREIRTIATRAPGRATGRVSSERLALTAHSCRHMTKAAWWKHDPLWWFAPHNGLFSSPQFHFTMSEETRS